MKRQPSLRGIFCVAPDTEAATAAAKAKIADFFITVLPPAYFLTHS
jgi:hypothetical protein